MRNSVTVSAAGAADMAKPAKRAERTRTLVVRLARRGGGEVELMGGTGVLEVGDVAAASAIAAAAVLVD